MLNEEGNEKGIKINRSNQQKDRLHVQHPFFSNQQKKQICTCSPLFVFLCRCFAHLQRCFVGLKRQTSQLHIIFMEELSYVLTQYFVSCVHLRFCFSLPLIFTFRAANISHPLTAALKFHVFLPTTFVSFVFNHSVIHVSVNNKITSKKTRLCCCFFFLKVRAAIPFLSK